MKMPSRFAMFRDRMQVFFLGLLLGLVLGGGFFLLKMDQYVKELGIYKSLTQQSKDDETDDVEKDGEEKQNQKKTTKEKKSQKEDTSQETTSVESTDSTAAVMDHDGTDEFVVRKDELLGQRTLAVVNLDGTSTADSLMRQEAGVKEEPARAITVEFWQSPLNYKGYKLSRSRLIVFGIGQEENVAMYKLDQSIYLKIASVVYRVENTADFHQFDRVNDETLLARLK